METKHTPGPWRVNDVVEAMVLTDYPEEDGRRRDDLLIARCGMHFADARLIAAAPDLLEALHGIADAAKEAMLPGTSANTKEILLSAISEDARAAIAKATGAQS